MDERGESRQTRQCALVLEELKKCDSHPTADALHRRVRKHLPKISLATVYRNLEKLVKMGLVRQLDICGCGCGCRQYDAHMEEHHHVRCVRCGHAEDIILPAELSQQLAAVASKVNFSTQGIDISGICSKCRRKHRE